MKILPALAAILAGATVLSAQPVPDAQMLSLGQDDSRELRLLSPVGTWLKPAAFNDPPPGKLRLSLDPSGLTHGIYQGSPS